MQHLTIKNIFVGLILLVLVISAFILLRNFRSVQQHSRTNGVVITTPKQITDASASIKYKIEVNYPSFSGLSDTATESVINSQIQKQMESEVTSFKQEVDQTEQNLGNVPQSIQEAINEFYITFDVVRADDQIVSVQFKVMDYQAGMDHPNNYNLVFNYDVIGKKQITNAALFAPNADYLSVLSTTTKDLLIKRFSDNPYAGDFINEGTAPTTDNFKLFTIGPRELNVIFDPYQVAPYYEGTQIVSLPFNTIRPILNPSLPL